MTKQSPATIDESMRRILYRIGIVLLFISLGEITTDLSAQSMNLDLNWNPEYMNCDGDGRLEISPNGWQIVAEQLEGPDCIPCNSIGTGGCVLDANPSECSNTPNSFNAILPVGEFSEVRIKAVSYTHLTLPTNREV